MELKHLIKLFKTNKINIIAISLLGGLIGLLCYYIIPQKYIATGSFYVKRQVEIGNGQYFTYDGYYNQQTALSYANTVLGFFESPDTKAESLKKLGVSVNEGTLRKFSHDIRVKKAANQLINLSIKGNSPEMAKNKFDALSSVVIDTANKLNRSSDAALAISPIQETPVIKETFRNIFLNIFIGIGLSFVLSTFVLSFKEYLK